MFITWMSNNMKKSDSQPRKPPQRAVFGHGLTMAWRLSSSITVFAWENCCHPLIVPGVTPVKDPGTSFIPPVWVIPPPLSACLVSPITVNIISDTLEKTEPTFGTPNSKVEDLPLNTKRCFISPCHKPCNPSHPGFQPVWSITKPAFFHHKQTSPGTLCRLPILEETHQYCPAWTESCRGFPAKLRYGWYFSDGVVICSVPLTPVVISARTSLKWTSVFNTLFNLCYSVTGCNSCSCLDFPPHNQTVGTFLILVSRKHPPPPPHYHHIWWRDHNRELNGSIVFSVSKCSRIPEGFVLESLAKSTKSLLMALIMPKKRMTRRSEKASELQFLHGHI